MPSRTRGLLLESSPLTISTFPSLEPLARPRRMEFVEVSLVYVELEFKVDMELRTYEPPITTPRVDFRNEMERLKKAAWELGSKQSYTLPKLNSKEQTVDPQELIWESSHGSKLSYDPVRAMEETIERMREESMKSWTPPPFYDYQPLDVKPMWAEDITPQSTHQLLDEAYEIGEQVFASQSSWEGYFEERRKMDERLWEPLPDIMEFDSRKSLFKPISTSGPIFKPHSVFGDQIELSRPEIPMLTLPHTIQTTDLNELATRTFEVPEFDTISTKDLFKKEIEFSRGIDSLFPSRDPLSKPVLEPVLIQESEDEFSFGVWPMLERRGKLFPGDKIFVLDPFERFRGSSSTFSLERPTSLFENPLEEVKTRGLPSEPTYTSKPDVLKSPLDELEEQLSPHRRLKGEYVGPIETVSLDELFSKEPVLKVDTPIKREELFERDIPTRREEIFPRDTFNDIFRDEFEEILTPRPVIFERTDREISFGRDRDIRTKFEREIEDLFRPKTDIRDLRENLIDRRRKVVFPREDYDVEIEDLRDKLFMDAVVSSVFEDKLEFDRDALFDARSKRLIEDLFPKPPDINLHGRETIPVRPYRPAAEPQVPRNLDDLETLEEVINDKVIGAKDVFEAIDDVVLNEEKDMSILKIYRFGDYSIRLLYYTKIDEARLEEFLELFESRLLPIIEKENALLPDEMRIKTFVVYSSEVADKEKHPLLEKVAHDFGAAVNAYARAMLFNIDSYEDLYSRPELYIYHEFGDYLARSLRGLWEDFRDFVSHRFRRKDERDKVLWIFEDMLFGEFYSLVRGEHVAEQWLEDEMERARMGRRTIFSFLNSLVYDTPDWASYGPMVAYYLALLDKVLQIRKGGAYETLRNLKHKLENGIKWELNKDKLKRTLLLKESYSHALDKLWKEMSKLGLERPVE